MRALIRARTLWRLGSGNLLRAGLYRALLRAGYYRLRLPVGAALRGPFFAFPDADTPPRRPAEADATTRVAQAQRVLAGELPAFSNRWHASGFPPLWQRSLTTHVEEPASARHWSRLPDFGLVGGDVKGYWESSRFDGLVILALGWLCSGRVEFKGGVERWLEDWCAHNPVNRGLQWKCGQEAGLRLMQTLLVAQLLGRWGAARPTAALSEFVRQHAARIESTMVYAVAQENNHGTSEAAALFIAGLFLKRHGDASAGARYAARGRRWLEERVARLVMADGSFSQHSVNYHRLMLDTCALAETMRRAHGEPRFSHTMYARLAAATHWLESFSDARTGDAPNLGANDGARVFVLDGSTFRDFRPSVRWASTLFLDAASAADERLAWLELTAPAVPGRGPIPPGIQLMPDGGYALLTTHRAWAMLRLPRFRFRPSHADALHLDLWTDGVNSLRDDGSFAYNAEDRWQQYFGSTAAHNTVQFDERDQMPRLSRFLFGDWLETADLQVDAAACAIEAAYIDYRGACHRRRVQMLPGRCLVVDQISGFSRKAVLRWRFASTARHWQFDAGVWSDGRLRVSVVSTVPLSRLEIVEGWESRHYHEKSTLPVLEAEVATGGTLTTEIVWPA